MVSVCARNVSALVDAKKPGMQWPAQQKMIEGGPPSFHLVTVERMVGAKDGSRRSKERWLRRCSGDFANVLCHYHHIVPLDVSSLATARPRPCDPPVTIAVRPATGKWFLRAKALMMSV